MHRMSSAGLSSVSSLVRTHHSGLCYRVAASAQSSALSPLPTPHGVGSDVNNKWYSAYTRGSELVVNNARNSPRMLFNNTLLLGRRSYESTAAELHPSSPSFCSPPDLGGDVVEFYKKTFNDHLEPLAFSNFLITTTRKRCHTTFRVILYVPAVPPSGKDDDIINPKNNNIRLYMNMAFVSDNFDGELLPKYLSFVKAVVNTNHPILDDSRQILQKSRIVEALRGHMVDSTLEMFRRLIGSVDYVKLWDNYGKYLKLGCIEDHENHFCLAPLLCFFSSKSDDRMVSLYKYMNNMKEDQNDIYYIASDSVTSAKNTPSLEKFIEKDLEVLFLVDPIDKVAIENLKYCRWKKFVDISDEDLE